MKHGTDTEGAVDQIVRLAKVLTTARSRDVETHSSVVKAGEGAPEVFGEGEVAAEEEVEIAPLTPVCSVPDDTPAMGDYVVSLRRGFRRLHRAGDCHMVPGVDYMEFRVLGSCRPSSEHFDAACKLCFKFERTPVTEPSSGDTSSHDL